MVDALVSEEPNLFTQEPAPSANSSIDRDHIGRGRGRGRGRGAPPVVEMTASGPFAMGPTLAGNNIRRSTPRSNFPPAVPALKTSTSSADNLSYSVPPSLKKDAGNVHVKTEDEEYYSDPDEGVEIIDMEHVHQMDWMAPDSIRKEQQKSQKKVKEEQGMF